MRYITEFKAYGHSNISSEHQTTLMITRDDYLTSRGNCIISIKADKSLSEFEPEMKNAARNKNAKISLTFSINDVKFTVNGRGNPSLTYQHPSDIVARKSNYVCDRTLMIKADKAAIDVPQKFLNLLKNEKTLVKIKTTIILCDTETRKME
jgi:hypothetical protein